MQVQWTHSGEVDKLVISGWILLIFILALFLWLLVGFRTMVALRVTKKGYTFSCSSEPNFGALSSAFTSMATISLLASQSILPTHI